MKLTLEKNRETIKRYGHLRPAPPWGPPACGVGCPGSPRTCTREEGHGGPHAAHGLFRRVVAVWVGESGGGRTVGKRRKASAALSASARDGFREGGLVAAFRALRAVVPSVEAGVFLVFFGAMVGFVIYWLFLMMG